MSENALRELAERQMFIIEPCDHGTDDAITCQRCLQDGRNYTTVNALAAMREAYALGTSEGVAGLTALVERLKGGIQDTTQHRYCRTKAFLRSQDALRSLLTLTPEQAHAEIQKAKP